MQANHKKINDFHDRIQILLDLGYPVRVFDHRSFLKGSNHGELYFKAELESLTKRMVTALEQGESLSSFLATEMRITPSYRQSLEAWMDSEDANSLNPLVHSARRRLLLASSMRTLWNLVLLCGVALIALTINFSYTLTLIAQMFESIRRPQTWTVKYMLLLRENWIVAISVAGLALGTACWLVFGQRVYGLIGRLGNRRIRDELIASDRRNDASIGLALPDYQWLPKTSPLRNWVESTEIEDRAENGQVALALHDFVLQCHASSLQRSWAWWTVIVFGGLIVLLVALSVWVPLIDFMWAAIDRPVGG